MSEARHVPFESTDRHVGFGLVLHNEFPRASSCRFGENGLEVKGWQALDERGYPAHDAGRDTINEDDGGNGRLISLIKDVEECISGFLETYSELRYRARCNQVRSHRMGARHYNHNH